MGRCSVPDRRQGFRGVFLLVASFLLRKLNQNRKRYVHHRPFHGYGVVKVPQADAKVSTAENGSELASLDLVKRVMLPNLHVVSNRNKKSWQGM